MSVSRHREASPSKGRLLVWSAAVRLCHWVLAATVLFDLVYDDGGWWHRAVGYVAVGAVLARFGWAAFAGGRDGLLALVPSLAETIRYVRGGAQRTVAHDPLGIWMVWLLWLLVLGLGVTGWMSRLDAFWGDDLLHDLHSWLADATLVSVLVHLLGVLVMSWRWRENLPLAMLNGRKRERR
jgi:cytochrome b